MVSMKIIALEVPNLLYTCHDSVVASPKFHYDFCQSRWIVLFHKCGFNNKLDKVTNLLNHVSHSRDYDQLKFALHLANHKFVIQTICPRQHKKAG